MPHDGLNSLRYKLINVEHAELYTRVHVAYSEHHYKSQWYRLQKFINESLLDVSELN